MSAAQRSDAISNLALPPSRVTTRQSEIIDLLLAGHPNKSIAKELGISLQTVKAHLTAIMAALRVENRTQLALAVSKFDQQHPSWRMRPSSDNLNN
jgi:DNA-binding NarL/FixJ family response regulator